MGALSPTHWAIIGVVLILLFGANKLPQMARGLGQSMRILRSEVREISADDTYGAAPARELEAGQAPNSSTEASRVEPAARDA